MRLADTINFIDMIKNALLYEDQLRTKIYERRYDPKYQYYFGPDYGAAFSLDGGNSSGRFNQRAFVSVNKEDKVIGYINYWVDPELRLAQWFGAVNFSDDKMTFGRDLRTVVDEIFTKFGMETLEFAVICGNPIEKSYDRMVKKIGGYILCRKHGRSRDMMGNLCDEKLYEITRDNYLIAKARFSKI